MAVHRKLGPGFLEAIYQHALSIEFDRQGIPHRREVPFDVYYEGVKLSAEYRADFVCFGEVLVEVKAHLGLGLPDTHQVVNYLRASGLGVGLLVNFGLGSLENRRFVFTHPRKPESAQWQAGPQRSGAKPADGKAQSSSV